MLSTKLNNMTQPINLNNFLFGYCAGFRPGNIADAATYYHLPVTLIFREQVTILTHRRQVIDTLETIIGSLIKYGLRCFRLILYHIHEFTENTALLSASFSPLKPGDKILEQIGATYTHIKHGKNYKIAALITLDRQSVIPAHISQHAIRSD